MGMWSLPLHTVLWDLSDFRWRKKKEEGEEEY
jgi:hypothetical protein